MTEQEIITGINQGDMIVLDNVSRWDVDALYRAGKLKDAPKEIKDAILSIVESCRESR